MTTLVLVDDDPADLALLRQAFAGWSAELTIEPLHSAQAAIDWFTRFADADLTNVLLVTDLNMPVIDGAELIRRVRQRFEMPPVSIVLSTSSRDLDVQRAYAAGANAYHAKPMGYHDTADLCHAVLDYWLSVARRPAPRSATPVRN